MVRPAGGSVFRSSSAACGAWSDQRTLVVRVVFCRHSLFKYASKENAPNMTPINEKNDDTTMRAIDFLASRELVNEITKKRIPKTHIINQ